MSQPDKTWPLPRSIFQPLLPIEQRAIELTAELVGLMGQIIGNGSTRPGDLDEFVAMIHPIQRMIMAQAAARLFPTKLRKLGEVCEN